MNRIKKIYKDKALGKLLERRAIDVIKDIFRVNPSGFKWIGVILLKILIPGYLVDRLIELKQLIEKNNMELFTAVYDSLIQELERINVKDFPVWKWKVLSLIYIYNRLYVSGWICRKKSKELLSLRKASFSRILALIEDDKIKEAKEMIESVRSRQGKLLDQELALVECFIDLLYNTQPIMKHDLVDDKFMSYLSGKKAIIIGPTVSNDDIVKCEGINDVDIIVRNNLITSKLPKQRVHISYYNGIGMGMVLEEGITKYEGLLDWLVIKNDEKKIQEKPRKIHRANNISNLLYMGTSNVLPIMIIDLKLNGVDSIRVSGNNLFLSAQTHTPDYAYSVPKDSLTYGFTVHNILSQHALLRVLYNHGVFIPDMELKRVLDLTTSEYAAEMEKIYL